jgi:hypothetical protein
MTDDDSRLGLLRGVGAVGIGAGALALFPSLATTVPLTNVSLYPSGVAAIHQLGDRDSFGAEDARAFSTWNPAQYEALVWLPGAGGAAGAGDDWAWHGSLVGAYFAARSGQHQVALFVDDVDRTCGRRHTGPRGAVKVSMCLDETPRPGDSFRAITWWHDAGAGRARYTGLDGGGAHRDTVFTRLYLPGLCVAVRAAQNDVEPVLLTDGGEKWPT